MAVYDSNLLQENGSFLLQENGYKILLERASLVPPVVTPKLGAGWFTIPEMRQKILKPERIYLKDYVDNLRE